MNPHTFAGVRFPLPHQQSSVFRAAFVALVGLAAALGISGCTDKTVTPSATAYITIHSQRAESQASSFAVSLQLDKATYAQGDTMKFALAIHNQNGVHQALRCGYSTTQRYDFIVRDSTAHVQVWEYAQDRTFDEVGGVVFEPDGGIADGDSIVYNEIWTLAASHGEALASGHLFSVTAFPLCVLSRITPPSITFSTKSGS